MFNIKLLESQIDYFLLSININNSYYSKFPKDNITRLTQIIEYPK